MKLRTEIIRHIAEINNSELPATAAVLRTRTFIRPDRMWNTIALLEKDGLIECGDDGIWLTESGWEEYERERPRAVGLEVLGCHADCGGAE